MSNNFNITRLANPAAVPVNGRGEAAKHNTAHVKLAESPVVRNLPPLTRYNAESGLAEPIEDMGALPTEEEEPAKSKETTQETSDRHTKWKEEQTKKKTEREEARLAKKTQAQVLAADHIRQGNLAGAAQALGMPLSELTAYFNNAQLGIQNQPKETKPLSPEEQKAADETTFRKEMEEFRKEQQEWRFNKVASDYIEKHIAPVLADQDKFEYINKRTDKAKTMSYVYDYINNHYNETFEYDSSGNTTKQGEILEAKDILESIEETYFQEHVAALEAAKKDLKKVAKYFRNEEEEKTKKVKQLEEEPTEPEADIDADPWARKATRNITLTDVSSASKTRTRPTTNDLDISQEKPMNFDEPEPLSASTVNNVQRIKANTKADNRPWRSLSRAEQLAIIRREEEEAPNKSSRRM